MKSKNCKYSPLFIIIATLSTLFCGCKEEVIDGGGIGPPIEFSINDISGGISIENLHNKDIFGDRNQIVYVTPPGGNVNIACVNYGIRIIRDDLIPAPDDGNITAESTADVQISKGPYFKIWMSVRFVVLHCEFHDIPADLTGTICEVPVDYISGDIVLTDRFIFKVAP